MKHAVMIIGSRRPRFSPVAVYDGTVVPLAPAASTEAAARQILQDLGHTCDAVGDIWQIL